MITKELIDFIKKEKANGRGDEEIKSKLIQNGWLPSDVEEGFRAVFNPLPNAYAPSILSAKPKKGHRALLFILLLLLVGGSASGYYFREELKTLPLIGGFFPTEEVMVPVEEDLPTHTNFNTNVPATEVSVASGVCTEDNFNCMLSAANICMPMKLEASAKGVFPAKAIYEIVGKSGDLCSYKENTAGGVVIGEDGKIIGMDDLQGSTLECKSGNAELVAYLTESFKQLNDLRAGVNDLENYSKTDKFMEANCEGWLWII